MELWQRSWLIRRSDRKGSPGKALCLDETSFPARKLLSASSMRPIPEPYPGHPSVTRRLPRSNFLVSAGSSFPLPGSGAAGWPRRSPRLTRPNHHGARRGLTGIACRLREGSAEERFLRRGRRSGLHGCGLHRSGRREACGSVWRSGLSRALQLIARRARDTYGVALGLGRCSASLAGP